MTTDQIQQLGLAQVARIHKEMRAVQKKMGVQRDLKAYFNYMRTEPKFCAAETNEGRAVYLAKTQKAQDAITPLLPAWFGILPKAPLVSKRVDEFRKKAAGKAPDRAQRRARLSQIWLRDSLL